MTIKSYSLRVSILLLRSLLKFTNPRSAHSFNTIVTYDMELSRLHKLSE